MVKIRRKKPNAMKTSECKNVLTSLCLFYTSDWFKHQVLRNMINPLFSNQILNNKILSESKKHRNPMKGTCKVVNFSWFLFATLTIGWNLLSKHKQTPFKNGLHNLFCKLPFCSFTHSLCENENIPKVCEESVSCYSKRNHFPSYPDHNLNGYGYCV